MMFREIAGLFAIVVGTALVVAAMIASGLWALAFLGGSAMLCGGVGMTFIRSPEPREGEVAPSVDDEAAGQPPFKDPFS